MRSKKILIIPAVALGLLVFILMGVFRQSPKKRKSQERPRTVRVIPAPEIALVPRAMGYGVVEPGKTWEAVAEVGGKVVEINPKLKKGALLRKGDILLRIDPAEYGLAKIRAQSDVENFQAQIKELEQKEKDIRNLLEVENRSLVLSKKELERKRKLLSKNYISKSEFEREEKQVLSQKNAVQNIKNTLNLIPTQREALLSKVTSSKAQLTDTDLNILKTTINAPFDCRISEVNIELTQYVAPGKVMVKTDNIGSVEILAQIPVYTLMNLVGEKDTKVRYGTMITPVRPDMKEMRDFSGFGVLVRVSLAGKMIEWKGRFTRVGDTLDPQTRTIGVYVSVENPFKKIRPGKKPLLIKNMYCEVELKGKPQKKAVIIPRAALHQETVYIANALNRLVRRKVEIRNVQGNLVSIKKGLSAGDQVIVTDVIPAIEGMLLKIQTDEELLTSIIAEATGGDL